MSQRELAFDAPEAVATEPQNFADCIAPGVWMDRPFEEYASWRAVNSGVVRFSRTPKHFHCAYTGQRKVDDSKDRKLGRAMHTKLLEPDQFFERFVSAGACETLFKTGERIGSPCGAPGKYLDPDSRWVCGKHGSDAIDTNTREIITPEEERRCNGMVASIKSLPKCVQDVLMRPGWTEASMVYEYGGFRMKGRADRLSLDFSLIIDAKKMQVGAGEVETCRKAIFKYGYHIQAAIYVKAIEALKEKTPEFAWLFVEDADPFDVQVIFASEEDIAIGWDAVQHAIADYRESPEHYGYIRPPVERDWEPTRRGLPAWVIEQWEERRLGLQF